MRSFIFILALSAAAFAVGPPPPPSFAPRVDDRCPKCFTPSTLLTNSIHAFSNSYAGKFELRKYQFKCPVCTNQFRVWEKLP